MVDEPRPLFPLFGLRQAARPAFENIRNGLASTRRGLSQATREISLPTLRNIRMAARAERQQAAAEGADPVVQKAVRRAAARAPFGFQSQEFVEKAGAGPARPVSATRIRVRTGL